MRVINVSLNELETKLLMIGFQGENEITQVRIDAADILTDYPNATPTLIVKPLFGFAYPVIVAMEGTDVVWEIDNSVLSFHGDGEIQLTFTQGTVIAKSYVGRIRIKRSLAVNGEAPDPIETWEQAATAKLAEVDAQIGKLEDMVEAAEAAKDQAQDIVDDAAADIQAAGAAQVGNVNTAGSTQVSAVQAKGTEVLNSIPADYSTLSGDVTGLKSAFRFVTDAEQINGADISWESGTITNTGAVLGSNQVIRSVNFIDVTLGGKLRYSGATTFDGYPSSLSVVQYANTTFISKTNIYNADGYHDLTLESNCNKIRLVFGHSESTPVLNGDTSKGAYCGILLYVDTIDNLDKRITTVENETDNAVVKTGTNEVTAKNIKSTASIIDFESGVEVIPNQHILNYDTSTNKYLFHQKTGYYLIRVDLDVIDCVVTAPEYSWTMTQNYYIACMTDANGVKAGGYALGNSSPHRYSMIALTSADDVMQIDFAKAKQNYPNAKYYYIGMVGAHDYEWSIKEPHKTLEWLKLTQKQTSEITENMQAELMPVEIILPSKIVAVKGHQLVIFLKNIVICPNLDYYYVSATATGNLIAVSHHYSRFISIKPTANTPIGNYTLTVRVRDKITNNLVAEKQVTISVIADTTLTGKKAIFIGDSLTDARVYPAEIQYNLSNGGITSIGTRSGNTVINGQTYTVNHEGRTGWSSNDYCTKSTFNNITNAFFNPSTEKFDFSYYMQQQGYSGVDVVCINLGTNSANPYLFDGIIDEVNEMIESIHTYDANIKILVSLICPSATQDGFGTAVTIGNGTTGSFDYYQRLIVKRYIDAYDNKITNVGISPVYVALDTEYDYPMQDVAVTDRNPTVVKRQSNQVHPSVYGYLHMADIYYNTILDLLD